MLDRNRIVLQAFLSTVLGTAWTGVAVAQRREQSWRPTAQVHVELRYDDNLFLLTAGRKPDLDPVSAADAQSGRVQDMESATDLIPTPRLEVGLEGPGLGGRALALSAEAGYEVNVQNPKRRHAELGFTLAQSLPREGRLRFSADWRPSYFHKNYLQDAVDLNADDNIGPEERRYEGGTSGEVDLALGYRNRLVQSTKDRPFGLSAELQVGYFDRSYDAPFPGRSRRGPGGGAALVVAMGRRWSLGLDYAYESLKADPTRQVMILDENFFGADFNGNGTFSDDSARAFELVDRSRTEQELGASLEGELSKVVTLELAYGRRLRSFSSEEPYDVSNRGRKDTRNEFEAELDARLARGLHLRLGARRAAQSTNRPEDPGSTGDETDYTRHVAWVGLRYWF